MRQPFGTVTTIIISDFDSYVKFSFIYQHCSNPLTYVSLNLTPSAPDPHLIHKLGQYGLLPIISNLHLNNYVRFIMSFTDVTICVSNVITSRIIGNAEKTWILILNPNNAAQLFKVVSSQCKFYYVDA